MRREDIEKAAQVFLDTVPHRAEAVRFCIQQVNAALNEAANMISEKAYETDLPDELAAMIRKMKI